MEEKSIGKYSIVGFPDERGVKNVNGRLGAALGPEVFLELFQKLNGRVDLKKSLARATLVKMGDDLELNHQQAALAVAASTKAGEWVIAVGGGHDYAYSWLKGFSEGHGSKKIKVGCINLDAHFDLRPYHPVMTSGSPFRRLIEEGILNPKNLVEFGIQSHCNAQALWDYAAQTKVKIVPFEKLRHGKAVGEFKKALTQLKKTCTHVLISLDLDALSFAFAPGVSAPQAEGFTASEVFEMLEIAGADKKVTSLGIFELAPALDVQNYTARLAAQGAWHFLSKKIK